MKKYNIQNYIRYKEEIKALKPKGSIWNYFDRTEVIHKYLPLVENLARKFSTSDQASGILSILDLIQEGSIGLILAVDKLDWTELEPSKDIDQTLKSFFSKRIKGAIRRRIDMHRGNMRIPEHRLNEMRKNGGKDKKMVEIFFNSIFLSIDSKNEATGESFADSIEDPTSDYNVEILNAYLLSLMSMHLNIKQYDVLRYSYGLACDRLPAKEIAKKIGLIGTSAYVRVSELKKEAINKLIDNVDHSQVVDYL
jgi:RNA polymerase sigma factor (sigma-70 family)|tara:strand:- start:573 stop:1328 length:756 start_codon:yes stop_codon:yes gene_type:complete